MLLVFKVQLVLLAQQVLLVLLARQALLLRDLLVQPVLLDQQVQRVQASLVLPALPEQLGLA